jgi:hypothetical protein
MSEPSPTTIANLNSAIQHFCNLCNSKPHLVKCGFSLSYFFATVGTKTYDIKKETDIFNKELKSSNIDLGLFTECLNRCKFVDFQINNQHSSWVVSVYITDTINPAIYKAIRICVLDSTIAQITYSSAGTFVEGDSQMWHTDIIDNHKSFMEAFYERYCIPYKKLNEALKNASTTKQSSPPNIISKESVMFKPTKEMEYVLDDGTTETESQRLHRIDAAIETIVDIGSRDYEAGKKYIRYIESAMKFRAFAHKFNNTNFAKRLGLVFSLQADVVYLCDCRVCDVDLFFTSHYSFFKNGGVQLFETFDKIVTTQDFPKKASLRFADKTITFTVKGMNGYVPSTQTNSRDLAIEFDIEADFSLRQLYMIWNGLMDNEGSDETQISLLEYISYINAQYLKTVS